MPEILFLPLLLWSELFIANIVCTLSTSKGALCFWEHYLQQTGQIYDIDLVDTPLAVRKQKLKGNESVCVCVCVCVLVAQSFQTLCDPMDCNPPGSSVQGILQARILEWVAIPLSRGYSWPRDQIWISHTTDRFFYHLSYQRSNTCFWLDSHLPGAWFEITSSWLQSTVSSP